LDTSPVTLNTARNDLLGGVGTQTAALAFGGFLQLQEQPKNIMELLGQHSNSLNTARSYLAGCWYYKLQL
jgi:hypothetical protein